MNYLKLTFCSIFLFLCTDIILTGNAVSGEITVSNATELQDAINNAQGGDSILLESGDYGNLTISNRNNSSVITIRPTTGSIPVFSGVKVQNSTYWSMKGFTVKPRYTSGADGNIAVWINGHYLVFEDSVINYADDISDWTASHWIDRAGHGIVMQGTNLIIRNNTITNVDHGITCLSTDSLVSGNSIINFRGDGIRALGDRVVYEYNTIQNGYGVDDNHDDGIQSWSLGDGGVGTGVVRDVIIRGNTIIVFEVPIHPLKTTLQGIGLFDGMFENWVIENNLIITNHWHGITILGAINCRVLNNTVLGTDTEQLGPPWIQIADHQDGTPSIGGLVRNNLATDFHLSAGVINDHNIEFEMNELSTYFVNPLEENYHLKATSPAVDAGSESNAPDIDLDGTKRPQGAAWDVGAFEFSLGDLNFDGKVDLSDVIIGLKIASGSPTSGMLKYADINNDGKIGVQEAIYALKKVAN